jgi:endonuclease-3
MTRKEKAVEIAKILDDLYPHVPIPLEHTDPYTLLVAVILSAQCTDVRVNQITPLLFEKANNPYDMVRLTIDEIEHIIRPCGLAPSKAKGIYNSSKILIEKYDGKVPDTFEALRALPSVGNKTANVVLSQAFSVPAFPVDTHIHRLAFRWGLSNGKNPDRTEKDLTKIFPRETWNKLHLQIIYFGREYCPARGHKPANCPICSKYGVKKRMN